MGYYHPQIPGDNVGLRHHRLGRKWKVVWNDIVCSFQIFILMDLLLNSLSFESLKMVNNLNQSTFILSAIGDIIQWLKQTRNQYADLLLTWYFNCGFATQRTHFYNIKGRKCCTLKYRLRHLVGKMMSSKIMQVVALSLVLYHLKLVSSVF